MTVGKVVAAPLVGLIVFYQRFISPMRPPTCRYYPSCSQYALTAIRRFGPVKGTWLAVRRCSGATRGPRAASTTCPGPLTEAARLPARRHTPVWNHR